MPTTLNDAGRFAELTEKKRDLEQQVRAVKAELDLLEEPLIDDLLQQGVDSLSIKGFTLYIHRQQWARPRDGNAGAAIEALRSVGLDDLVVLGTQKVSAWFRQTEAVPPEMQDAFEVTEHVGLRARRST